MKSIQRFPIVALATFALTVGSASVLGAQQPPDPQTPQQSAQAVSQVQGELLRVDTEAKTLTIKTADGSEMEFRYDASTEIVGAQDDAAGLATETGSTVTVYYETEGTAKTATRIEVKAKD